MGVQLQRRSRLGVNEINSYIYDSDHGRFFELSMIYLNRRQILLLRVILQTGVRTGEQNQGKAWHGGIDLQ